MEELKTLKDLCYMDSPPLIVDGDCDDIYKLVNVKKLKQNAINWIKEFQKHFLDTELVVDMAPNFHYTHGMRCGAILVLKQMYNITEEDLV